MYRTFFVVPLWLNLRPLLCSTAPWRSTPSPGRGESGKRNGTAPRTRQDQRPASATDGDSSWWSKQLPKPAAQPVSNEHGLS